MPRYHSRRYRRRRSKHRRKDYRRALVTKGGGLASGGRGASMKSLRATVKYLMKINQVNTQNLFYGYRECNEVADGSGKTILKTDLVTGDELPLHIYPLRGVVMNAAAAVGAMKLNSDGYDFTTIGDIQYLGSTGNTVQDGSAIKFRKLLCNYHDIKIMLWGEADRKTRFEIMLVKLSDIEFDPALEPIVTDVSTQNKRILLFKALLLRKMITNPIIGGEVIGTSIRREMKILWRKEYNLRETLSTEDQAQHKIVKIFRPCHDVVDYNETNKIESVANFLNADEVIHEDFVASVQRVPRTQDNLFLIITGNANKEDETLSYDINIKSKYTLLAETIQN